MMISKKRPIICIAVFLLMFLTVISLPNKASASSKDFVIQGNNLVAYKGKSSTVTIPKNVKTIVGLAFYRNPYVKKVIIPDSVKIIDEAAFLYCYDLHTVKLGKSVTTIGDNAFKSTSLKTINFPKSLKNVNKTAFDNTPWLKSRVDKGKIITINNILISGGGGGKTNIKVPSGVTKIGDYAFNGEGIKTVTLPNTVKHIGKYAFYKQYALKKIVLPDSLETIDEYAFAYCEYLTSVKFGNSLKSIGNYAFKDCKSLESLEFPTTLDDFGLFTFQNTPWFDNESESNQFLIRNNVLLNAWGPANEPLELPETITKIAGGALWRCYASSIKIPDGVTAIGESAFYACANIKEIDLPDSVVSIGKSAFVKCDSLAQVNYGESLKDIGGLAFMGTPWQNKQFEKSDFHVVNGVLIYSNGLEGTVKIPSSVKTLGNYSLAYSKPSKIVLGKSVTKIEKDALYSIFELKSIEIPSSVKTIEEGVFDELLNRDFTIIGKKGSAAEKYAKTYGFKFKSK